MARPIPGYNPHPTNRRLMPGAHAQVIGSLRQLTPLLIGGVLLVVSAFRGLFTPRRPPLSTLDDLRRWIPGRSKRMVAAVLGPPKAVRMLAAPAGPDAFDESDTWYYALQEEDRSAMAVVFGRDVVERVEFFRVQ